MSRRGAGTGLATATTTALTAVTALGSLIRPARVVSAITRRPASRREIRAVRAIGLRLTAQAVLGLIWPQRTAGAAAATDAVHAATMLAGAAFSRRERRMCLTSAGVAVLLAGANAAVWARPEDRR